MCKGPVVRRYGGSTSVRRRPVRITEREREREKNVVPDDSEERRLICAWSGVEATKNKIRSLLLWGLEAAKTIKR